MNKREATAAYAAYAGISEERASELIRIWAAVVIAGCKTDGEVDLRGFGRFTMSWKHNNKGNAIAALAKPYLRLEFKLSRKLMQQIKRDVASS